MNLLTKRGIVEVKKKPLMSRLLCRHGSIITGIECSPHGLVRISGQDVYTLCRDCGKVINEDHIDYD